MTDQPAWLSISEAAQLLGVHVTTLRRWSDQGLLEYVRTPGGKRKYQKEALAAFISQHRSPVKETNAMTVFQDQAIVRTRQQIQSLGVYQTSWYTRLSEEQRVHMRSTGSQLVALMLHYSAGATPEIYLEQARRITREYGRACRELGVDMANCVQTFLLFRQPILNSIHETDLLPGATSQQSFQLFERLNRFLDEALVAMIDEYQNC